MRRLTLLSFALLAFVSVGCSRRPLVVHAGVSEPMRGLVVSGQGEAKSAPDIARTTVGVEMRADTAEQATAEATQRMVSVITAIKAAGVADKDLRTQNLSITFEQEPLPYPPADKAQPQATRGVYRASNMVEITVRNLDSLGRLLKVATDAGANNVWGVSFELEHPEALASQARKKAVENAKKNAAELAQLSGVKLGAIVSVTESGGGYAVPMMKTLRAEAAQEIPVERGEVSTTQTVQLVYAIEE